jgi:hypothetical protein
MVLSSTWMPQASSSRLRLELRGPPEGSAGSPRSTSAKGSTKNSARPPPSTNWSSAYSVASGRFVGWTTISTSMSSSIALDAGIERAYFEQLTHLFGDHPGLAGLARHRVELSLERQAAQQADHRLLRVGQRGYELGQVVFEEGLLGRIQERDDVVVTHAVGAGHAQVNRVGAVADVDGPQAEAAGPVFLFGEGQRIDDLQDQFSLRAGRQRPRAFHGRAPHRS